MLFFGSPVFAVITTLSAFMAGLGLGSFYFARLVNREGRPLRLYAFLVAGIGCFALIFPLLLSILNAICVLVYRGLNTRFYSLSLIRFVLSFLVLLIPSTLMGGALLVLSKFFLERFEGFKVSTLFTLNTLGATVGCIGAGFFFIQLLGLQNSVCLGAAINLGVVGIVLGLDLRQNLTEAGGKADPVFSEEGIEDKPSWRLARWGFAISGFCALVYAVLWTRILVSFLSNTTYAFSVMLATLLFGGAFGSFLFAWIVHRVKPLVSLFGLTQIGIGLSVVVLMPAFGELHGISRGIQAAFGMGRIWELVAAFILMILPAILMGASFPLVTRIYTISEVRLGRSIGAVYPFYAIGAFLGSLCTGFILIPLIGVQPSIFLMAGLNTIMGCTLILRNEEKLQLLSGAAIGGAILTGGVGLIVLLWANTPLFLKNEIFWTQRSKDTLVEYSEAVDANIITLMDNKGVHRMYIDNNQVANTSRWVSPSHRVIAHLPLLLHPRPKRALVVGFGMGVTPASMVQHGVRVDVVESSQAVIEAARKYFPDANDNLFGNSLFNHTLNDERNYVLMTRNRYDVISTGIIHPLVSSRGPTSTPRISTDCASAF